MGYGYCYYCINVYSYGTNPSDRYAGGFDIECSVDLHYASIFPREEKRKVN